MRLNQVTLDVEKLDEGEWRDIPGDPDGLQLLLRGRRSQQYKKAQGKALRRARRAMGRNQDGLIDAITKIDAECIAQHCLLGWRNFFDDEGGQVPFNPDLALSLMTERRYEPFQEMVRDAVDELDNATADMEDEIAGKSSNGSTPTETP